MTDAARLLAIKDEIKELVNEAMDIVKEEKKGTVLARANAYWYPAILINLDGDNGYVGTATCSMEDTIKDILEEHREIRAEAHNRNLNRIKQN